MLNYVGEAGEDHDVGNACQLFVTVVRSSDAGIKYWRERLTMSYVIVVGMGKAAVAAR